jgi:hypothetical protein
MANKKKRKQSKGENKTYASKRTLNTPQSPGDQSSGTNTGASFQEHDAQRRLGSFEGTGEHARTGSRGHQ